MSNKRKSHPTGPTRLTMADPARLAGVCTITVSRALADSPLVNPATRERIRRLASEHGYKLSVHARNLRLRRNHGSRPGRCHAVAVIVEMSPSRERTMADPYPLALLGGISQELTSAGYNLMLATGHGAIDTAAQAADGLILLGQGADQDAMRLYDKLRLPLVIRGAAGIGGERHIVVGADNRHGGMSAAERFVSIGRRHPVFVGNPDHPEVAQRLCGFAEELALHDIKPLLMRRVDLASKAGVQAVRSLHNRRIRFDAILASSDLMAMGAIHALADLGRSVPQDVSVIGYDDTPQAAAFLPPLSTVSQNWQEGGVLLARKVLGLLRGEAVQSEVLPSSLVIRGT